jgi:hypothetical protein
MMLICKIKKSRNIALNLRESQLWNSGNRLACGLLNRKRQCVIIHCVLNILDAFLYTSVVLMFVCCSFKDNIIVQIFALVFC